MTFIDSHRDQKKAYKRDRVVTADTTRNNFIQAGNNIDKEKFELGVLKQHHF